MQQMTPKQQAAQAWIEEYLRTTPMPDWIRELFPNAYPGEPKPFVFSGQMGPDSQAIADTLLARDFAIYQQNNARLVMMHDARPYAITDGYLIRIIHKYLETRKRTSKGEPVLADPSPRMVNTVRDALLLQARPLTTIRRAPFIAPPDGWWQLITHQAPRYYRDLEYFLDLPDDVETDMPKEEAKAVIEDYLGEFPYATTADRHTAYGTLLGIPLKPMGVSPIVIVDKPKWQTGATKLVQTIAHVAEGRPAEDVIVGAEEETDKRLVGKISEGHTSLCFDNVDRKFVNTMVTSGLTAEYMGGRLLGTNSSAYARTAGLSLYLTGNNPQTTPDLVARSVRIRLDAKVAHPELRTGFRHQLPGDALADRVKLLSAVCSLVQGWMDAGSPTLDCQASDSFAPYMESVAGLADWCGWPEYNLNREDFRADADSDSEEWEDMVNAWWGKYQDQPQGWDNVLALCRDYLDLAGNTRAAMDRSAKAKVGKHRGQAWNLVDGRTVILVRQSSRTSKARVTQWQLQALTG